MLKTALKSGSLRSLKIREGLVDLTSNDYLGLSRDPAFQRDAMARWEQWAQAIPQKTGATGSRLLTGNHRYFEETEEKIARFHGFASATLFNCGYMANLAVLSSLCREGDAIIADIGVHASLHDGMRLSKAKGLYFRHNDLGHLEERLRGHKGRCFAVVESLYSMGGDFAPLKQIADLGDRYGAYLIVDEVHAIGVLGKGGQGLVAKEGLQERVFACMGAFGKALGAHGAVLLGSSLLKQMLVNFARPLIYTTALPLSVVAAIACSYERFPAMDEQREHLAAICRRFCFKSHIHPVPMRGNAQARLASQYLASKGFDVRPILSPTVPKGEERLRLIAHAFNREEEIGNCLEILAKWRDR